MNKEVNFEIAKLLKEKGFNLKVVNFYNYDKVYLISDKDRQIKGLINYNPINWNMVKDHYTSAPTIAEVVMWLYEKHEVWISIDVDINGKFIHIIKKYNSNDRAWEVRKSFTISEYCNSPTEAYEAAIKYTLENKIQGGNK